MAPRSGGRPMPPQAMTTSMPFNGFQRPGGPEGAADPDHVANLETAGSPGHVTDMADGVDEQTIGSFEIRTHRDGSFTVAGDVQHVELSRLEMIAVLDFGIGELELESGHPFSLRDDLDDFRPVGQEQFIVVTGAVRGSIDERGGHAFTSARMAATSSVRSIPAGHQVIQRPQPTQPSTSNCSFQVPNLWVNHWR